MKTLFIISLFLLPLGMQAQAKGNADYKSSRIHYYVPYWDCMTPQGYLDFEYAYEKGLNVWVLMELDNGDVVFERRPWGNFQYGIIPGTNGTGQLNRQQAIYYLNSWIDAYYSLAEQDEKYNYLGYSFPYYMKVTNVKLGACPEFDKYDQMGLKSEDIGMKYVHSGRFTNDVAMSLWMTYDYEYAVFYPTDELPCVDNGIPNDYTLLVEFDIEYYLPESQGYLTFAGIPMDGSLSNMVQRLRNAGFMELKDDVADEVSDEFNDELFGMLGKSENQTMMKGNFYGVPCEIMINADPGSKNVYSIVGNSSVCCTSLSQAEVPFAYLIKKLSNIYGTGRYTISNAEEKEYRIRNEHGDITLRIEKIGIAMKNEGKFEIRFQFMNDYKVDARVKSNTEKSQHEQKEIPWQQQIPLW